MIVEHQPTIFPSGIRVAVSSRADGSMKDGREVQTAEAIHSRRAFLQRNQFNDAAVATFSIVFDGDDFCRYDEARPGAAQSVDGLSTNQPGVTLALPLADCTGAVFYDPKIHAMMMSHLGRHSVEQDGARKSVQYMQKFYGSQPEDILVWTGPSPNGDAYPLWKFDNKSFQEVIFEQLQEAGILLRHIEQSSVDTITDDRYYSHSEFLKGNRSSDGRFMIAAVLSR